MNSQTSDFLTEGGQPASANPKVPGNETQSSPEIPLEKAPSDQGSKGGAEQTEPTRKWRNLLLTVAALGVVFGDIGTSPLYSVQTAFALADGAIAPNPENIMGIISMIFWSLTLIVALKYCVLVMHADDEGEGGVLVLAALVARKMRGQKAKFAAIIAGVVGATVFFGDSVITPAISVLSAIEGLEVIAPALEEVVVPIAIVILTALFLVQRFGTGKVGRAFGPIMLLWFLTLALAGVEHIVRHPEIVAALSPHHAFRFGLDHPGLFFLALGAVVLTVTGVEALYADMGHFGAPAIRRAWFMVAYPALVINYLGQGGLLLTDPKAISNPFFLMVPAWARIPLVILAAMATIIASQAVISGSYSTAKQASRLGFLQNFRTVYTSKTDHGQIYIPVVNYLLLALVLVVVVAFQDSTKLATAYGIAVTMTFLITSTLYAIYLRTYAHSPWWQIVLYLVVIGGIEVAFFSANITKIESGGWLPLLVAAILLAVMMFWHRWSARAKVALIEKEGYLFSDVERLLDGVPKMPGTAVYLQRFRGVMPYALRASVELNDSVREKLLFVHVVRTRVPHIHHVDRVKVEPMRLTADRTLPGAQMVTIRIGFMDSCNMWALLGPDGAGLVDEKTAWHLTHFRYAGGGNAYSRFAAGAYETLNDTADSPTRRFHIPPHKACEYVTTINL
ncbi:potassium transporter Kup [Boudabousia tangfeifanii]|nr:KUP/HAK/KT family potassium transporter [Boudabousia tangfeifanii]